MGKYDRQADYDLHHTRQFKLKLNCRTDADIIDWLDDKYCRGGESMQGAIKALIRADIAAHGGYKPADAKSQADGQISFQTPEEFDNLCTENT